MSKTGYGEGSVYKRKDGRWVAVLILPNGKRRDIYGKTEREARRKRKDASARVVSGQIPTPTRASFGAIAQAWMETFSRTLPITPKSRSAYCDVLRLHVLPEIGNLKIEAVTPSSIGRVLLVMEDKGLSASYRCQAHKAMSHVFKFAMGEDLCSRNPVRAVTAPSGPTKDVVVPTADQVKRFIVEAPDERTRTFIILAAYLGLRISEVLDLKWSHVDFDKRTITIWKGKKTGRGYTAKSLRLVETVAEQLANWRRAQQKERLSASWWASDEDWIITTSIGTRFDAKNFRSKHFKPLADGIAPGVTPHGLRHGLATRLMEEGIPLPVVSEQMRHSSTRITADIYSHVTPRLSDAAAETIEQVYGDAPSA